MVEEKSGPRSPLDIATACRVVVEAEAGTAILVEGWSDEAAVETLARRFGPSLRDAQAVVLPVGGATNIARFVQEIGPRGLGLRLAGLYDVGEEQHILRSLERAGLSSPDRTGAEALGFFACDADLEDELIRALGTKAVEGALNACGELHSFRRFQAQPAQRARTLHAQLHRFLGTRSGRKIRYGALLVDELDLERVPRPLRLLLDRLSR